MLNWIRQIINRGQGHSVTTPGSHSATPASASENIAKGNALFDKAEYPAACAYYLEAVSLEPANAGAHCKLGLATLAAGEPDRATAHLTHSLSLDPSLVDARLALGDLAWARDEPDSAEQHWRTALSLAPNVDAPYLALCRLLVAKGALTEARQLVSEGIVCAPASADLHYYLGNLQFQEQQYEAATGSFRQALTLQSQRPEILANLGLALLLQGQPEMAIAAFREALAIEPNDADIHLRLGNVLLQLNRFDDSIVCYRMAISLAPGRPEAYGNLGSALLRQGYGVEGIEALRQALALEPGSALAHYNLGTALQSQQHTSEAIAAYQAALTLEPGHAESLFNLGTLFESEDEFSSAIACYEKLTVQNPAHAAAYCNLGRCHQAMYQLEEALACYRHAVEADGLLTVARINISDLLMTQNRFSEAITICDDVLATEPGNADAHFNRSLALLAIGDYRSGWREYEYRWLCSDAEGKPDFHSVEWDGRQDLAGKTILLYGEQGLGDTLQFIRYAGLIAQRGAIVQVLVPQALRALAATSPGVTAVFTPGQAPAPSDFHCAMMSLPLLCGSEVSTIPAPIPYFFASSEKQSRWREKLERTFNGGLRVGLVWAGNPRKHVRGANAIDRMRSLRFEQIAPLLDVEDVQYYSLQLGDDATAQLNGDPRVIDFTGDLDDFEDTAALISNLDLVISVDTSVAHLTGAIGKPIWILNRYNTCWRWLMDRDDSPWYPSARLFRQPSFGDWTSVMADARQALSKLAEARRLNSQG